MYFLVVAELNSRHYQRFINDDKDKEDDDDSDGDGNDDDDDDNDDKDEEDDDGDSNDDEDDDVDSSFDCGQLLPMLLMSPVLNLFHSASHQRRHSMHIFNSH